MLSREDYMRLLECETVGAIASFLSRTEAYGRYFDGTPHPEELRRWELEEIITLVPVMEEAPFGRYLGRMRSSLLDAWGARFDVEVIKRVLRMIVTGLGSREALRRWVGSAPLSLADEERLLSAQSLRDVLESVRGGPLEKVLGDPLRRVEKEARGEALFHAKTAMDSFFLTRILSEARKLPVPERRWVRRLFGVRVDLINIYWIYRGRRFFRMSPEEALAMTLPVRYRLGFEALTTFAFAPDAGSMVALMRESRYGAAFPEDAPGGDATAVSLVEMELEHDLYRFLWSAASEIFRSGSAGVHVPLAYLTLRELEVKDLFTIIEGVRYHYDTRRLRGFLINPGAGAAGREGGKEWPS